MNSHIAPAQRVADAHQVRPHHPGLLRSRGSVPELWLAWLGPFSSHGGGGLRWRLLLPC